MAKTIGLFIDNLAGMGSYQEEIFQGADLGARAHGFNLLVYSGGSIDKSPNNRYESHRNIIYEYARAERLDGLLFSGVTIGNHISEERFYEYMESFRPLPMVSVGGPFKGFHSAIIDNSQGLRQLIGHLAKEHGRRRIAFIRGPEHNADAIQRLDIYRKALAENGLTFDPELTYVGNFLTDTGIEAVEHWLSLGLDFDAVLGCNDNMALGAMHELLRRGKRVPGDISVAGFDDISDARSVTPPLSTVRQPVQEQAQKAVDMLADLMEGRPIQDIYLPTEMVLRESCGCTSALMNQTEQDWERVPALGEIEKQAKQIKFPLRAFLEDVHAAEDRDESLPIISHILTSAVKEAPESVGHLQSLLTKVYLYLKHSRRDQPDIDYFFIQARNFLSDLEQRELSSKIMDIERQTFIFSLMNQALSSTFKLSEICSDYVRIIPELGIPSFWLSLYEDPSRPKAGCRFIAGFDEKGFIGPGEKDIVFDSADLFPPQMRPSGRRWTYVINPLYFKEHQHGIVAMEVGPYAGIVYETIFNQLCSAVEGATMLEHSLRAQEAAVARSKAIEERLMPMAAAAGSVQTLVEEKTESVRSLAQEAGSSAERIEEANRITARIVKTMSSLLELSGSIEDISQRVNILGLNAAIEAARAGNLGKGFSVIASEIRKLAETTQINTKQISDAVSSLLASVKDSESAGRLTSEAFRQLDQGIRTVLASYQDIAASMEVLGREKDAILGIVKN